MRPQRTIRAINCVLNQNFANFHAMFIFDGCPYYDTHKKDGIFDLEYDKSINKIEFIQTNHYGGWGYYQRNLGISKSESDYTIFYDNDDVIIENHFANYYEGIANTDYDMVYFDTFLEPRNQIRNTQLSHAMIGHSEIIVKTNLLKSLPPQSNEYGHDYKLIQDIIQSNAKVNKSNLPSTYIVKGLPNEREINID